MNYFYLMGWVCVYLIFLSCLSTSPSAHLAESSEDRLTAFAKWPEALYPIRLNGKWGYINRTGDLAIMPEWDHAEDFRDGLAVIARTDHGSLRYGMIDRSGVEVVPVRYENLAPFSGDFARVQYDGKWGYLNRNSDTIIPIEFTDCGDFSEGHAFVIKDDRTLLIDEKGAGTIIPQLISSVHHPTFVRGKAPALAVDGKTGFMGLDGQWEIQPKFHSAGNFSEGLAWAMIEDTGSDGKTTLKGGYIDTTGRFVIPPDYEFGWNYSEGHATVWKMDEATQQKIWYILDHQGNPVLSHLRYRNMGVLRNGLIPIQNEAMEWGFMDIYGNEIIPPQYTGLNHFHNGMARMEFGNELEGHIVYINPKGEGVWRELP